MESFLWRTGGILRLETDGKFPFEEGPSEGSTSWTSIDSPVVAESKNRGFVASSWTMFNSQLFACLTPSC